MNNNDETELLEDNDGNRFYVLKNSSLNLDNEKIKACDSKILILNNKEYFMGKLIHRLNGPAIEWINESKTWMQYGLRHRLDGPAAISFDGRIDWFMHGLRHRLDGPATISSDGTSQWYKEGKLHRKNGPAIEWSNGNGRKSYYINGRKKSEKEYMAIKEYKQLRLEVKHNKINKKLKI